MRFISAFAVAAAATLVAAEPAKTSSTSSFPPHAVVSEVAPQQSPPPGCSPNYEGDFEIAPVNYTSVNKRSVFPYFQAVSHLFSHIFLSAQLTITTERYQAVHHAQGRCLDRQPEPHGLHRLQQPVPIRRPTTGWC